MNSLIAYLPQDRRQALARAESLPEWTTGAALFADISGFTPLTEALNQAFGPRRGAEALTQHLNQVYEALITEVERYGGSVLSFAGDAMICWFDAKSDLPALNASHCAVACALALQQAIAQFAAISLPNGTSTVLALKATVASGPARRLVVGDPKRQLIDTLAGATIARTATAEHLANRGEVLIDQPTLEAVDSALPVTEWRTEPETGVPFAVLQAVLAPLFAPSSQALPLPTLNDEQLKPWLLPAVYEREVTGHGAFLTEFRPAVVLFLRFRGWDYDRSEAGVQLDTFIRQVQLILAHYEGILLQLAIGDKGSYFYAVFGAPLAHEDDPQRAVKAALDLRQMAAEFEGLAPVQLGVTRGVIRAGAYGGTTRRTYGVLGDEVNLAARLMQTAAPGEILISGRVQQAIAGDPGLSSAAAFSLEPRPPFQIKGKAEPLPVFALLGTHQRRAIRLQEPSYALPMVGREAELALITQKLELALLGQGQIIGITAEAGLGKSRLVAEVIRLARRRHLTGYGGACQADGVNISYLVWRPIFWALFDLDPAAPLRKQIRNLEGELEELAPERVEALPLLGTILDLPLPDNDFTRNLEPQFRKSALEAILLDCLRATAREAGEAGGGLLLVLEDLHWLDPASHDLLERVAQAVIDLPVLIVLAYRPLESQRLQALRVERLPYFTKISLVELNPVEAEQATRAKLAQLFPERNETIPVSLIEQITTRAQGNPFYLEELLNYLRDRSIDPWSFGDTGELGTVELPTSLHSLILSRIDQLSGRQQLTLKIASVIGRVFRFTHLNSYYPSLGEPEQVKADLGLLSRLELTPLETPEPELTYLFKHIVTREVAYESLPYATRAALHEQYARYLETTADPGETHYAVSFLDLLAYHYDHSDNLPKRREYLRRAGEVAAARYANIEAVDYLSRALTLTPDLAGEAETRFELLLRRMEIYDRQGNREAQGQDVEILSHLAERLDREERRAEAALQRAIYAHRLSDYLGCINAATQAIALGQTAGALTVVGDAYLHWARALLEQGDYQAAHRQTQLSLSLARQRGDRSAESRALHTLGVVASYQGDHAVAQAYFEQSLNVAQEMTDRRLESTNLNSLGIIAYEQGAYEAGRRYFEDSLRLAREIGDRDGESRKLNNLGSLAGDQGDNLAARVYFEQVLHLSREMGDRQGEGIVIGNLGTIATRQGDYIAARAYYEQSLDLSRAIGYREGEALALWGLGNVGLGLGHLAEAADFYQQALSLRRELGHPALTVEAITGLVRLALAQADLVEAQTQVEEILSYLAGGGTLDGAEEPFRVYLTCYQVLQATCDSRAETILTTGYNLLEERAAKITDETMQRMFWENIPYHQELAAAWAKIHNNRN